MYNATQLVSGHLNDSQRDFAYCNAPQFNATICLLLFASSRSASQRDLSRRGATHLSATLLNDLFVTSHLNATICLLQRLSTRLGFSQGTTAPRRSPRLNSTQRFVYYFASLQCAALRNSTRLSAALLSAIQRNELKLN